MDRTPSTSPLRGPVQLRSSSSDLSEVARSLGEARRALTEIEATALSAVAESLAETTGILATTVRELDAQRPQEWFTPDQAARHLGCTSVAAFERVVTREGIPKHYLSDRLPRYSRSELDAWLSGR